MSQPFMSFRDVFETHDLSSLQLAKHALDRAGIPYRVLNEYTLQTAHIYAMGGRGARLQVTADSYFEAWAVLEEVGFVSVEHEPEELSPVMAWIDTFTARFPLLGRLPLPFRLVVLAAVLIIGPLFVSALWSLLGN